MCDEFVPILLGAYSVLGIHRERVTRQSSAWIEFLRDTASPTALAVEQALDHEVVVTDPIRMELLAGARDDLQLEQLRRLLSRYSHVTALPQDYETASMLYRQCGQKGRTVRKLIDCLIAAIAIRADTPQLHLDTDFESLEEHTDLNVVDVVGRSGARDKGCGFPGCSHTRFVNAHHIQHWADGGETSVENMVLLCSNHHKLVHEGGYSVNREKSGELFFRRPDGKAVPHCGYRLDDQVAADSRFESMESDSVLAEYLKNSRNFFGQGKSAETMIREDASLYQTWLH